MKTIQISTSLSTNLLSEFQNVQTIEIENKPFAEGAFGEVYVCLKVNGQKPSVPQVIKLFKEDSQNKQDHNYNTIRKLQQKIDVKNQQLKQNSGKIITDSYPALKGLPQFSFEGNINGKLYRGFASTNLKKIGFEEFIDILDKSYKEYQKISIDKKMLIAFHLASGFKLLQEIFFIHADLKPEAIFINTKSNECAIIDFDSGTITENKDDTPNTWGAPNDWVAPEIWEQLKQIGSGGLQQVKVNLLSDLWSVAVGIHYILTTTHPLFYLNELSPRVTKEYFKKYKWPEIAENEPFFNERNKTQYIPVKNWLQNTLPNSIYKQLYNTVNYGYLNPIQRTTYNEWEKVLSSVQVPPIITQFKSNSKQILLGNELTLEWEIQNSTSVKIDNGIGIVKSSDVISIKPSKNTIYKLMAKNAFDKIEQTLEIEVLPPPKIVEFKSKHQKIGYGNTTQLVWNIENAQNVELNIGGKTEILTNKDERNINPTEHTKYVLIITALDGITKTEKEVTVKVFKKIEIKSFTSDFIFVVQSIPITLTWEVENASKIIIEDDFGKQRDVSNSSNLIEHIKKDCTYRIRCSNDLFNAVSEKISINLVQNKYELDLNGLVPRFDQILPDIGKAINLDRDFIPSLDYEKVLNIQTIDCNLSIDLSNGEIETKIAKKITKPKIIKIIVEKLKSYIQTS
ncbi:protein kinase domain-containing protein [Flavobacterium faecale]|uniref:protein kinase domain-containing protein n=1 Tax=Flavobacterium faecale TaxID=1355330 RepID=UPI00131EEAF1|nr:protein kinase [Flavobacterium faecale]